MIDLGLDLQRVLDWFPHFQDVPFILVRVDPQHAATWRQDLSRALRRCYITDAVLTRSLAAGPGTIAEILASKLPDPGATRSGDFGEILVYLYLAAKAYPETALGATKWRLKQDRTKPAPHSDVVLLVLPTWPAPSAGDYIVCAEVKTKATEGDFAPIAKAIEDLEKDRTSRLSRTLVWLRERALVEDLGDIRVEHLQRFMDATDDPQAERRFVAAAVISDGLVDAEIAAAVEEGIPDCSLVVFAVPQLRDTYTAVFDAALVDTIP